MVPLYGEQDSAKYCGIHNDDLLPFAAVTQLQEIEIKYVASGFPGCIGCIDCMHLDRKSCPKVFKGQYRNPKGGNSSIISCDAMVDRDI